MGRDDLETGEQISVLCGHSRSAGDRTDIVDLETGWIKKIWKQDEIVDLETGRIQKIWNQVDLETERKQKIWKQDENIGTGNKKYIEDLEKWTDI